MAEKLAREEYIPPTGTFGSRVEEPSDHASREDELTQESCDAGELRHRRYET